MYVCSVEYSACAMPHVCLTWPSIHLQVTVMAIATKHHDHGTPQSIWGTVLGLGLGWGLGLGLGLGRGLGLLLG